MKLTDAPPSTQSSKTSQSDSSSGSLTADSCRMVQLELLMIASAIRSSRLIERTGRQELGG